MLQVPFDKLATPSISWFLQWLDECDWLTHLKLSAPNDGCGPDRHEVQHCFLPELCDDVAGLQNLTAFELSSRRGKKEPKCHDDKDLHGSVTALISACAKLEYVELQSVAYGAYWEKDDPESPEKIWLHLSEGGDRLRRPEFFAED